MTPYTKQQQRASGKGASRHSVKRESGQAGILGSGQMGNWGKHEPPLGQGARKGAEGLVIIIVLPTKHNIKLR